MQISSRFTIAVHIMTCIDVFKDTERLSSDFIANSVGTNPVVIRRILGQLKRAGLVNITRGGQGEASMAREPDRITLYDIYMAVDSVDDEELFHFHDNPNPDCPVGRNIHSALDRRLYAAQKALEDSLRSMKLSDVINDTEAMIRKDEEQRQE